MAQADPELFTGQDEDQTLTLADEFLVFAHHSEHGVVFLAHVPQLKRYRDDVRERLLQEAWDAAFHATRRIHDDGPINLGVGLRGTVSYGAIATAVSDQRPAMEFDESLEPSSLYPFFAARAVTTEPAKKEAKPFVLPVEPSSTPALTWEVLHATGVPESYATTQLQSSEGDFDRCVAAGVDALEIGQRFDVRLHLDKKGRVNKLAKYAGQEAPDPIHDCLSEASKRWEIPASTLAKKGGIVVITFRWALPASP